MTLRTSITLKEGTPIRLTMPRNMKTGERTSTVASVRGTRTGEARDILKSRVVLLSGKKWVFRRRRSEHRKSTEEESMLRDQIEGTQPLLISKAG